MTSSAEMENIEHPTLNSEHCSDTFANRALHWMFSVGCSAFDVFPILTPRLLDGSADENYRHNKSDLLVSTYDFPLQEPEPTEAPTKSVFRFQRTAFERAVVLVRCYYACALYFALALLPDWAGLLDRKGIAPLWPVAWLNFVPLRTGIACVLGLYLTGALVAAAWPGKRWARILAFAGLFEWTAFNNSLGNIGHNMHVWVLTSALLMLLPEIHGETSRTQRQKFLFVFWSCQAMTMLVYSMAGIGKLAVAIYQLYCGHANAFMPGALAAIVGERLLETNSRSLVGPWLIAHPLAGWPLMLGSIYLQLFAFLAVFRPALHRVWGLALIVFHIGVFLLLTISFPQSALLLALLFVNSPFRRENENWRYTLAALPLFGRLFQSRCAS